GDYPAGTTPLEPATAWDKWDGDKWVTDIDAQQAAIVSAAAIQKSARISEANSVTQAWQTQLLLGIITDADKATLTAWMKYIQAVQATDLTSAPAINWPEKPE
ncbi:MAG TPA: phage tail protein, partial [Pantoea sp.]|nr:phage tail protein [Pantoea sp.]